MRIHAIYSQRSKCISLLRTNASSTSPGVCLPIRRYAGNKNRRPAPIFPLPLSTPAHNFRFVRRTTILSHCEFFVRRWVCLSFHFNSLYCTLSSFFVLLLRLFRTSMARKSLGRKYLFLSRVRSFFTDQSISQYRQWWASVVDNSRRTLLWTSASCSPSRARRFVHRRGYLRSVARSINYNFNGRVFRPAERERERERQTRAKRTEGFSSRNNSPVCFVARSFANVNPLHRFTTEFMLRSVTRWRVRMIQALPAAAGKSSWPGAKMKFYQNKISRATPRNDAELVRFQTGAAVGQKWSMHF